MLFIVVSLKCTDITGHLFPMLHSVIIEKGCGASITPWELPNDTNQALIYYFVDYLELRK